ncbi:type II secretion system F family protein, partial [Vibrio tubiashii]|nr:type II secretion system F family protein [Vibrio tubiashii]
MDLQTLMLWAFAFMFSMLIAGGVLKAWDNTRANIATRKIIGSTREERKRIDLIKVALSQVSFNKEETRKKLVAAGFYSDYLADVYYLIKIIPFIVCLVLIGFDYFQGQTEVAFSLLYLLGALG